jgi:hypothetical protein
MYLRGGRFMNKVTLHNTTMENLTNRINNLREVLNEICCADSNIEMKEERLAVSRSLDKLIVEYMKD